MRSCSHRAGTESIALAVWGGVRAVRELGTRIVLGAVEHPAVGGVAHALESDGFEVVTIPVDRYGRVDLDRYASGGENAGHAARLRPAREPRARDDPAGRRGRPPRSRGGRPLPHGRVPDRGSAPRRCAGARRRPPLALRAQVRRPAGRRSALRPPRARDHRLPLRRRPRAETPLRDGEHPGDRRHGGGAHCVARHHGRSGGRALVDHRRPEGPHRRRGAGRDGPWSSDAPDASPRGVQRRRARPGDADDDARRPGVPRGCRLALQRPAGGSLPCPRADRVSRGPPGSG